VRISPRARRLEEEAAMKRAPAAVLFFLAVAVAAAASDTSTVTRKGWFGDENCSRSKVGAGATVGPNGQECTRKCIREGVPVVFIDEQAKALYRVDNPKVTEGIESDYVEMVGTVDAAAKTVHVDSVRVLEKYVAKCSVPPPAAK
jgi:hypothetical protein